jgi:hypothetical protein
MGTYLTSKSSGGVTMSAGSRTDGGSKQVCFGPLPMDVFDATLASTR